MVPNFGNVGVGQMVPMQGSIMNYPDGYLMQNNYGQFDLSNITNQINSLEQRVNRLENLVNNNSYSNNYNSSNYQMM